MPNRRAPGSRRRVAPRLAAVLTLVAVSLLGAPGTASAYGTVSPLLDCVVQNSNGTYTAVLGYSNSTGRTQRIAVGSTNMLTPSWIDQVQPTTFATGTHHGVFSVTLSWVDLLFRPSWKLNGDTVDYSDVTSNSCPPGTQMPSEGNGAGVALGLLGAGLVGAVVVRRHLRRLHREAPRA